MRVTIIIVLMFLSVAACEKIDKLGKELSSCLQDRVPGTVIYTQVTNDESLWDNLD